MLTCISMESYSDRAIFDQISRDDSQDLTPSASTQKEDAELAHQIESLGGRKDPDLDNNSSQLPECNLAFAAATSSSQNLTHTEQGSSILQSCTSYPDWLSWWESQPLLSKQDSRYNWVPISNGSSNDNRLKRKWNGEHEPAPRPDLPGTRIQDIRSSSKSNALPCRSSFSSPCPTDQGNESMLDMLNADKPVAISTTPEVASSNPTQPEIPVSTTSPHLLQKETRIEGEIDQPEHASLSSRGMESSSASQDATHSSDYIQIPVNLVPDQSVSPRTKSIQVPIPRPSSRYSSPYSPRQDTVLNPPISPPASTFTTRPGRVDNQAAIYIPIDRILPQAASPSITSPCATAFRQRRFLDPDMMRKPSLYKIPPWPASTSCVPEVSAKHSNENGSLHARRHSTTRIESVSPGSNSRTISSVPETSRSVPSQSHRTPRKFPPNL